MSRRGATEGLGTAERARSRGGAFAGIEEEEEDENEGERGEQEVLSQTEIENILKGLDLSSSQLRQVPPPAVPTDAYLEDEVRQLKLENEHVRAYAQRLQNELGRLSKNSPKGPGVGDGDEEDVEEEVLLSPWVTTPHLFSPLLVAYDAHIIELRSRLGTAERQLAADREHIDRLTQENDQLSKDLDQQLQARVENLENLGEGEGVSETRLGLVVSEQIETLSKQVEVLEKERSILEEVSDHLQRDVEEMREEGKTRDQQLLKITQNFQSARASLKSAQDQVEGTRRERDAALLELRKVTTAKNELTVQADGLREEVQSLERECSSYRKQVHRLRQDLDNLALRANDETELQLKRLEEESKELRSVKFERDNLRRELEAVKENHRKLRIQFDQTQADCEEMISAMESLKHEIFDLKSKEETLTQREIEARELVEQAKLERDQAVAHATALRSALDRHNENRENVAKENVRAIDESVRKTKGQFDAQLKSRHKEIEEVTKKCLRLEYDSNRARQEQKETTLRLDALKKTSADEMKRLEQSISKAQERAQSAESNAIQRELEAKRGMQDYLVRIAQANEERVSLQETIRSLQQRLQSSIIEIERQGKEIERLAKEASSANEEAVKFQQTLENVRLQNESRIESIQERSKLAEQRQKQRVSDAEAKVVEMEQTMEHVQAERDRLRKQAEETFNESVEHHEQRISDYKQAQARLEARVRELTSQLDMYGQERAEMTRQLREQETHIRKLESSTQNAEKRFNEAKVKLAQVLAAEESRVMEVSQLRRQLDQFEIDKNRALRERDFLLEAKGMQQQRRPLESVPFSAVTPSSPSSRQSRIRIESSR